MNLLCFELTKKKILFSVFTHQFFIQIFIKKRTYVDWGEGGRGTCKTNWDEQEGENKRTYS